MTDANKDKEIADLRLNCSYLRYIVGDMTYREELKNPYIDKRRLKAERENHERNWQREHNKLLLEWGKFAAD